MKLKYSGLFPLLCLFFTGLACQQAAAQLQPPQLSISGTTSTSITLSWTAVSGASGYKLYEGISSSTLLYQGTALTFTHGGLTPGCGHYYRIKSYASWGESALSPYRTGYTNLVLTITGSTSTTISMSWSPGDATVAASGYKLYEGASTVPLYSGSQTSFTHTGLQPHTLHCYTVKNFWAPPSAQRCGFTKLLFSPAAPPADGMQTEPEEADRQEMEDGSASLPPARPIDGEAGPPEEGWDMIGRGDFYGDGTSGFLCHREADGWQSFAVLRPDGPQSWQWIPCPEPDRPAPWVIIGIAYGNPGLAPEIIWQFGQDESRRKIQYLDIPDISARQPVSPAAVLK